MGDWPSAFWVGLSVVPCEVCACRHLRRTCPVLPYATFPNLPDVRMLRTLSPLKGHVTTVTLTMVFHLFDLDCQTLLAHRIAQILSPTPGSMIIGRQMGSINPREISLQGNPHYVHNTDSWERMWSEVYPRGAVEHLAVLVDLSPDIIAAAKDMVTVTQFLNWAIKLL
jgi:hypothetical protein